MTTLARLSQLLWLFQAGQTEFRNDQDRGYYEQHAKRVCTRMTSKLFGAAREPSEAMIAAAKNAGFNGHDAANCWRTMIDSLLEDE
jgi:hypothetical protein